MRPFESKAEHLEAWLDWVWLKLCMHVRIHGHRMLGAGGTIDETCVGFLESAHLMVGPSDVTSGQWLPDDWPQAEVLLERSHAQLELIRGRVEVTGQSGVDVPSLPLEELRALFRLDDHCLGLLVLALARDLNLDLERAYRFVQADFTRQELSVGLLLELSQAQCRASMQDAAALEVLVNHGLLQVEGSPGVRGEVRVPEAVLRFVQGGCRSDDTRWRPTAWLSKVSGSIDDVMLHEQSREALLATLRRLGRQKFTSGRLVLRGPRHVGRRTAYSANLAAMGMEAMVVELHLLPREPERAAADFARLLLEARLRQCGVLLRADRVDDDMPAIWAAALKTLITRFKGPLAVSVSRDGKAHQELLDHWVEVCVEVPDQKCQRALWERTLEASRHPNAQVVASEMGRRVDTVPGIIINSVRHQAMMAQGLPKQPEACWKALISSVHDLRVDVLQSMAKPIKSNLKWEDAVLDPELRRELQELLANAMHRTQVMDEWGMDQRISYGTGLSCLFYGPPGTGKTMTATLIAQELGRTIHRVDLSRLVSKWIGETEKNLGRLFDAAERSQSVLLFDEADSLFSQRTSVKSSNDRFANMEVAYLLQRMEAFDGIAILTTNIDQDLDEALTRRLRFRLYFPMPEESRRVELWRLLLPPRAPQESNLDLPKLGRCFEFSGGHILNAIMRASYSAAASGEPLSHKLLYQAATKEARSLGMLVKD